MNYLELHDAVKNGTIVGAFDVNGKKDRLFISASGGLCRFNPRSSRRGYCLQEFEVARYTQFIPPKASPTGEEKLEREYRIIEKYKRMAGEASFTNPFIRDCLAIPDFDLWRKDLVEPNSWEKDKEPRPKTLYELHVTTGTNIDGKVISVNRIAKKYPLAIERLRESVRNQSAGTLLQTAEPSLPGTTYRSKPISTPKPETFAASCRWNTRAAATVTITYLLITKISSATTSTKSTPSPATFSVKYE